MPSILTIVGTCRDNSYSSKVATLINGILENRGATTTLIDGCNLTLRFPGQPETSDAKAMQRGIRASEGVVFVCPEYHGSFPAFAKLIVENLGYPSAFIGKPVSLVGIASGRLGATKSLEQLRSTCSHMGAVVLSRATSIANVQSVITVEGACIDTEAAKSIELVADSLLGFLAHYRQPPTTDKD